MHGDTNYDAIRLAVHVLVKKINYTQSMINGVDVIY